MTNSRKLLIAALVVVALPLLALAALALPTERQQFSARSCKPRWSSGSIVRSLSGAFK